jgi:hypothetical protein
MSSPSRFLSGVATVDAQYPLGNYPFPDPFHTSGSTVATTGSSSYTNDFNTLIGTDFTVSGSSSTFALANGVGGTAVLTPGGATTATAAYKPATFVQFQAGKKLWYTVRFKASAVGSTKAFYAGLRNGVGVTDGLWFVKPASSTSLNLVSTVGSTATTLVTGVDTVADDTWIEVSIYFDGTDILVYNEHDLVARVSNPTIGASATTLTNVVLSPVFQITPTATDTLTVDFVMVAQEVTR